MIKNFIKKFIIEITLLLGISGYMFSQSAFRIVETIPQSVVDKTYSVTGGYVISASSYNVSFSTTILMDVVSFSFDVIGDSISWRGSWSQQTNIFWTGDAQTKSFDDTFWDLPVSSPVTLTFNLSNKPTTIQWTIGGLR